MGWPYRFADLTEAQKHERRVLLDWYSLLAQTSAFILLLTLLIVSFASRLLADQPRSDADGSASPQKRAKHAHSTSGLTQITRARRRFTWWCGDPLDVGGFYLGRKGDVAAAGAWLGWLLLLCVLRTGDDYLHLTKRFGIVAASQLPLHYLLAVKSPYSPLQLLTRTSHERLNIYHQLLGRIITTLLYLHAAFYLNFYVLSGLLASKLREAYVLCGLAALLGFTAIGGTALAPVRRWSYRIFYVTHVSVAAALLPILFFHVSHIRIYLYEAAPIYILNVVLRSLNSRAVPGSLKVTRSTDLVEVNIPPVGPTKDQAIARWRAGQHAYIAQGADGAVGKRLRINPFSVASVPATDGRLKFVMRVLNGNTARFAQNTKTNVRLMIEGPYGVRDHVDNLLRCDRVLLIAGGVGGTFTAPLYRALLSDLSPSKGSYRRQKVSFIWTARSLADVTWALPEDVAEREGFVERLQVFLTGASAAELNGSANATFVSSTADEDETPAYAETEEGIELEQREELLSSQDHGKESVSQREATDMKVHAGRPDLKRIIDRAFAHGANERVGVVVCGPNNLARSVRKEVGRWAERDVWFWEEDFAL